MNALLEGRVAEMERGMIERDEEMQRVRSEMRFYKTEYEIGQLEIAEMKN